MKPFVYKSVTYKGMDTNAGFTLLEILLAVFIFSLITVGAYQVFGMAQKNAVTIKAAQARLHDISLTFELLEKDLTQIVARTWRDPYSNAANPPLQSDNYSNTYVIRMVKGGWRNPLSYPRSNLQLVTYRLQDDQLQRLYHRHIDNIASTQPQEINLLNKVERIEFTFIDRQSSTQASSNNQALNIWPPPNTGLPQNPPAGAAIQPVTYPLPIAVEVTLELEDMGTISRIIALASGA